MLHFTLRLPTFSNHARKSQQRQKLISFIWLKPISFKMADYSTFPDYVSGDIFHSSQGLQIMSDDFIIKSIRRKISKAIQSAVSQTDNTIGYDLNVDLSDIKNINYNHLKVINNELNKRGIMFTVKLKGYYRDGSSWTKGVLFPEPFHFDHFTGFIILKKIE